MSKKPRRLRLDWIPLDVGFITGRKAVALGVATKNPIAWAHVIRLWTWAAENARDGLITGPDAVAVIEHAAGWTGTAGALVECMALPHIRLLDETSSGFAIHDWSEHTGKFIVSAEAKAAANAKRQDEFRARNAPQKPESRSSNALRNAPVTPECPHREGEREGEEKQETSPRAQGAAARSVILGQAETYSERYPKSAALLAECQRLKCSGAWSPDASTRQLVEEAIGDQSPAVVALRVVEEIRANGKPWLGMHLPTIRGVKKKPSDIRLGSAAPAAHAAFGEGGRRAIE